MNLVELPKSLVSEAAFAAVAGRPYPVFLDSGGGSFPLGLRSFVAADPFLVVQGKGDRYRLSWPRTGAGDEWRGNPFQLMEELYREYAVPDPGPFPLARGGMIGYLAYDLFPHLERIPRSTTDDLGMPDLFLGFYDTLAVFDHRTDRAFLVSNDCGSAGGPTRDLGALWRAAAARPAAPLAQPFQVQREALRSNFERADYLAAIRRAKEHIAAGDVYQINLSQRFDVDLSPDPLAFYGVLRRTSPAPFGGCLFPDGFGVYCNSPERYLLIDGGRIETRPIKGTRPRGRTPAEDRRLADELRASEKDRAEHVMIVDLERNDLGRVCTYNSVHVPEFATIESYANVHHMVSTVAGRVAPRKSPVDCIRNSFPGGSITGAPKVRAMEIIEDLEPTARGAYCGSVGYLDFGGRVDLNIAIRTAIHRDGRLYFQAGGGIVADSDPEEEHAETITKAQSFVKVVTGEGRLWTCRAAG